MRYKLREILPISIFAVAVILIGCLSFSSLSVSGNEKDEDQMQVSDSAILADEDDQDSAIESEPPSSADAESASEETSNEDSDNEYSGFPIIETGDSGYVLSDDERRLVECAVMCEAGGESVEGQMMVAQSILDGTLRNDYTISKTIYKYNIATTAYSYVTDEVKESVSRVFDDGERITEHKTDLWYNPAITMSLWHEEQEYVITVGSHRFFWMNSDMT